MGRKSTREFEGRSKRLLIIDDEKNVRHILLTLLDKSGFVVDAACDGYEGLQKIDEREYDFILCDMKMPRMSGIDFLKSARDKLGATTVIMMSAYGTIDIAVDSMKLGAYDYISKPFKTDEVLLALKKAEERERLRRENLQLRKRIEKIEEDYNFCNMVGKSKVIQAIFRLTAKVAQYDSTVLITGESGTGKELIAKGIHFSGKRAKMPIISINCGSIPGNLLESELFGYNKGAFTGADRNRKGLFEEADGGTLFLDEMGELPLNLQVKLLRVLQEGEIRPLGDSKPRRIDVRVISATARNLEEEVTKNTFREDLYYRLNVLWIKLPALRERKEDIPLLSQHFISHFNKELGKNIEAIAPGAMSRLMEHDWPGNVRELKNVIERAVVLADKNVIGTENFPSKLGVKSVANGVDDCFQGHSLKTAQKVLEKKLITKALMATNGNRTKAARLLEISHPSLLTKIRNYNIKL